MTGARRSGTAADVPHDEGTTCAAGSLRRLGADLLTAGGLEARLAVRTAELLLEADLMGHPPRGRPCCPGISRASSRA